MCRVAGRVVIVVEAGIEVEDNIFGPPTIVLAIASCSLFLYLSFY